MTKNKKEIRFFTFVYFLVLPHSCVYFQVFLKYYHIEELARKYQLYNSKIILVQAAVRRWLAMVRYRRTKDQKHKGAIVIQKGELINWCPIFHPFMPNWYPIFHPFMPNWYPIFHPFMPYWYPIFHPFMPNWYPIFHPFMPNWYPIFHPFMPIWYPIFHPFMPNWYPIFHPFMPNWYPIFHPFMPWDLDRCCLDLPYIWR